MRLLFSSSSFRYAGQARPGFPIILGDDLRPVQPAQDFLVWSLLDRGRLLKTLTWEAYGRALWDFVSFLDANELRWDLITERPGESVVSRYRDWSLSELKLSEKTVNARLRVVTKFYEWANGEGLITALPFAYERRKSRVGGLLAHAQIPAASSRPSVFVRQWEAPTEFLSVRQIQIARGSLASSSQMLLFDLMARVGLRSCEARTFPVKYVFNPATRPDCSPDTMIRVLLDPRDMAIKYDKAREVDIPYTLMSKLYAYAIYERNARAGGIGSGHSALILNTFGRPYTKSAVAEVFTTLSRRVGFVCKALMLRHSYAIHTLNRLRNSPTFVGEPLLYVRDRLGHSSVQTTMTYLRQIEQLSGALVLAVESEFDRLFDGDEMSALAASS